MLKSAQEKTYDVPYLVRPLGCMIAYLTSKWRKAPNCLNSLNLQEESSYQKLDAED